MSIKFQQKACILIIYISFFLFVLFLFFALLNLLNHTFGDSMT